MNESSLQFAQPLWIAAGVLLVVLGLLAFMRADRRRRADLDKLAHPRFHGRLVAGWSPALRWTRRGLWLAAIMSLALTAARPRYGYEWREVKRRGIDILFAVDTSRSMLAEDLVPNRLERARMGIFDFLGRLEGDRVGLVPFAGTAFALCPLTLDYDAFRESLNTLNTDLIPQQGTDLASAIHEAGRLFDAEKNNQRFLVLMTDGEDLEGEALKAAEEAAKDGTTIYTVGVGAEDGQMIPVRDRYGRQEYLKDESGQPVKTKLDAATLEKIATATGGLYVPLGRGAEGLDAIYQKRLALAPKSELAQQIEKVPLERFQWPLGVAVILLALQTVLGERRRERKKVALASVARRVRPVALLLVAWAFSTVSGRSDVVADYNGGTQAYANGEFEQAIEKLGEALETPDLGIQAKAYYNLGSSLYRIGQAQVQEDPKKTIESWGKSLKAFEDALALNATDEDARFNRDLVQRKLDELKKQQDQQLKDNKDQKDDKKEDQKDSKDQKDQKEGDNKDSDQKDSGQDQKQDQQKGDQDKEQQGKEGDPSKSDQGKEGEKKEGESGEEDKEAGEKEGEKKSPGDKSKEQQKDGKDGDEKKPGDSKEPGKEKPGMKGQEEKKPQDQQSAEGSPGEAREGSKDGGKQGAVASEARKPGEMSRDEAIRLLETLANDERLVIPAPLSERNRERQNGSGAKRKTW